MQKEQQWAAVLSLVSCLASAQTYAGEAPKYPSNRYLPDAAATSAAKPGTLQNKSAVPKPAEKPVDKTTPSADSKKKAAPATAAQAATQQIPAAAAKPAETLATKGAEAEKANRQPQPGPEKTASATVKPLPSLSILESILAVPLAALFFLVLIRGKMIKRH